MCDNVNMMREELDMNNIDIVDMDILRDEALAAEVAILDERYDLECFIYDMHKAAYGVKGRHYDFKSMSMDDLRKLANRVADAVEVAEAEEAYAEVAADFEAVGEFIEAGAGDREPLSLDGNGRDVLQSSVC